MFGVFSYGRGLRDVEGGLERLFLRGFLLVFARIKIWD